MEKWLITPGETRVIDVPASPRLKVGLIGGQVDIVAHDEPTVRIEVHGVTVKDLRIEVSDSLIEIDHPQLRWDNFLDVFRNFGTSGPKADISVAVPRDIALTLGVVSASALVSGLNTNAKLNTVSGEIVVDGHAAHLTVNGVSGEVQVRDLQGSFAANSVSGDIAVTGSPSKVVVDTVSGNVLVDAVGAIHTINVNTVSGDVTARLDEDLSANFAVRSVGGKVQIDGIMRSSAGLTNYTGTVGDLNGHFLDLRCHTVSGRVTVLRRYSFEASANGATSDTAADGFES